MVNNNNNNNNNRGYTPLSEKCSQSRVFISQCHMNHIIQGSARPEVRGTAEPHGGAYPP